MGKPWWLSKTLWFNFLMALVTFANEMLPLLEHFTVLGVSEDYTAIARTALTVIILVGNAILRVVTDKPLATR